MADKYKKRGNLTCTEKEKEQLEKISKSKSEEYRKVQRARIFLLYMEHTPVVQISKEVGLSRESVYSVLDKAFAFGPIAGLEDLSGRGVSPVISEVDKAWVIHLACSSPREYGYSYEVWTYRLLARHIQKTCEAEGYPKLKNAGKSLLHGILDKAGIKPHKISYYLEKRDENFEEKMAQVLAVYKEIQLILL